MSRTFRPHLLPLGAALLALALLVACGGRSAPRAPRVIQNTQYQASQPLADRYENLEGTALFDVSGDAAQVLGRAADQAPGGVNTFFVLLNPKNPTEGILVRAGDHQQVGLLENQPSRKLTVTGKVEVHKDPSVLSHFQERFGISLARDEKGNPVWIDNELSLGLDPNPQASPTTVQAPEWLGQSPAPGAGLPAGTVLPSSPLPVAPVTPAAGSPTLPPPAAPAAASPAPASPAAEPAAQPASPDGAASPEAR